MFLWWVFLQVLLFQEMVLADAPGRPPFRQALPGYEYSFPRDFGSHDDFRVEWWYYTGNLEDESGKRSFGYQLTFFRVALEGAEKIDNPSRWKADRIYFSHLTVSDVDGRKFYFFERINRKGIGLAGAEAGRLHVWNEDWRLTGNEDRHLLKATESGVGVDLELTPIKKPVVHGDNGVSVKGSEPGNASHYFSYTRMDTRGRIFLDGAEHTVRGSSWMDHEFSSNPLNERLTGWDWFSVQLDNGTELMLYQLRLKNGGVDPHSSGTLVFADGSRRHIQAEDFSVAPAGRWKSGHTGIEYPAGWEIALKNPKIRLTVSPSLVDQELYELRSISGSYWEGSVSIAGEYEGAPARGKGYVELVGYGKALKQVFPE